jgi:hypothetical protein
LTKKALTLQETGLCRAFRVHGKGQETHGKGHTTEFCTVKGLCRAFLTHAQQWSFAVRQRRRTAKKSVKQKN